jgi:hypothetical protein
MMNGRILVQEPGTARFAQILTPAHHGLLQRACACGQHTVAGGECAACREKREGMQRAAVNSAPVNAIPPIVHDVLTSSGQPLDAGTRAFMEPRFGHDFSQVRVHTDARAAESARAVNALAYTVGRDMVFGAGQYEPRANEGKRLLAHELTHVVQQKSINAKGQLTVGSPNDDLEREAATSASQVVRGKYVNIGMSLADSAGKTIQRDLATPPPDTPVPAQPDLTDEQIRNAIVFNRARYDEPNTKLIQNLLGGPVTGVWTEENIVAIAATQEQYGLAKDGMVGFETFRFLNNEERQEGLTTSTANCLTSFRVIGPDTSTFVRDTPTQCTLGGHFRTASQFSNRCNCSQFQYRQFIRGHFRLERGGVVTDLNGIFSSLPSGNLTPAFQEDGDTTDFPVNYGHRDQPADADPEDHYIDDRLADNQANGCRYRNEDSPDATLTDCQPGDVYDADINFRGEIQRNGLPIESKFWTAVRGRFVAP